MFGLVTTPPDSRSKHASFSNAFPHPYVASNQVPCDFFDSDKKLGFLAQEGSDFKFIGPDRASPSRLSLSDYISMAIIIHSTGLPNYKQTRFPVYSDLNIEAWERLPGDSPNVRLLDYIKFPLLIINPESHK